MEYLAHRCNDKTETVYEHLVNTSEYASMFASSFGSSNVGKQLGLLHDVGKLTNSFQDVLNGITVKKDHAIVSGIYYQKYGKIDNKWLKRYMALIMACHHCELYGDRKSIRDLLSEDHVTFFDFGLHTTLDSNKTVSVSNVDEWSNIIKFIDDFDLNLDLSSDDYLDLDSMSMNEKMFYIRMLYSCLVDADYTATAMFEDSSYYMNSHLDFDVDMLLNKFSTYYDDLVCRTAESPLNHMRNYVYDICSKKGQQVQGLCSLTAPTGIGKTLSLMKFALENARTFGKQKIIIILPFLSIINQNAAIYSSIFGEDIVLIDDSQTEFDDKTRVLSERWSAPIIVTTSVNFFETLFDSKAVNIRRLHQVANSVIVFDECQTLSSSVLNTSLEILQSLCKYYNSTVLLSTATHPSYKYRNNEVLSNRSLSGGLLLSKMNWDSNELIDDVNCIFSNYSSMKHLNVDADTNNLFDYNDLVNYFKSENQVLYVFNTVKHATNMYEHLISCYDERDCFLITSNLCSSDKISVINIINSRLRNNQKVYVAATQCIEAGVDFDFPTGARECAPFDSVVQTAGRINRNCDFNGKFLVFKHVEHGLYDYPSAGYKWASDITYNLFKSCDIIDLYDIKLMDLYFDKLFHSCNYKSDNKSLYDSMDNVDYSFMTESYSLIESKNQIVMIVKPYYDFDVDEYNDLVDNIQKHNNTITKGLMQKLSKYTVQLYVSKKLNPEEYGCRLSFRFNDDVKTNWYLCYNEVCYDKFGFNGKT